MDTFIDTRSIGIWRNPEYKITIQRFENDKLYLKFYLFRAAAYFSRQVARTLLGLGSKDIVAEDQFGSGNSSKQVI